MWKLQVLIGTKDSGTHDLAIGRELVIGRDPTVDIVVSERSVSRRHCRLTGREEGVEVLDLGSANGVYLDKKLIQRAVVGPDDHLQIGTVNLRVSRVAPRTGMIPIMGFGENTVVPKDPTTTGGNSDSSRPTLDAGKAAYRTLERDRLALLIEAGKSLSSSLELDELLEKIMDHLFQILPVRRGVLVLLDAEGRLVPRSMRPQGGRELSEFCSQHIIREVISEGKARIIEDASLDHRLREAQSILAADIKAAICAPLVSHTRALGALYADFPGRARIYSQSDLEFFGAFASLAAVALENSRMQTELLERERLQRDLEIAAEIQKGLLPDSALEMKGLEVDWAYWPAKQIGGDFYDCCPVEGGRVALVLGDVSGKSVGAALFMARLTSFLRAAIPENPSPGHVLTRTNALLGSRADQVVFATAAYLLLDPKRRCLEYASAGHLPALILDADTDEFRELPPTGIPLGIDSTAQYEGHEAPLPAGSIIVLYTDGIIEARDPQGQQFGLPAVQGLIRQHRAAPVRTITQALVEAVGQHCRGSAFVRDDIAILTVRVTA